MGAQTATLVTRIPGRRLLLDDFMTAIHKVRKLRCHNGVSVSTNPAQTALSSNYAFSFECP
jgi:hypothetical protein